MPAGVVIVGTGQAGFQVALSLRTDGYDGPITLIGDEPGLPYQRPPLSKGFLAGKQAIEKTELRPENFYRDHRLELIAGETVTSIANGVVTLASGAKISYDSLVLAVGVRNRKLPLKGAAHEHVRYLRTVPEAVEIKQRLESAKDVVVIGGGFIGLEVAAAAREKGKSVTVVEMLPRLMARVVAPLLSEFYLDLHGGRGAIVSLNAGVTEIREKEVVLSDGSTFPADLIVVGIGVVPNTELARDAGLAIGDGIAVDEYLRTSHPNIYAIGDCAEHPNRFAGGRVRIESVQNAVDQAKSVAAAIVGKAAPYHAVPWFWTDQFDINLQMAGLSTGFEQIVTRGEVESRKFSVFYFKQGRVTAIDSINRPGDHLAGRKMIAASSALTPQEAADLSIDLKTKI